MEPRHLESLRLALHTAAGGDLEPLVALYDPELDWRGLERGHLWWKAAPS